MSFITREHSETSVVFRGKLLDSSSTEGEGLVGLTSSSAGLIIAAIANNESSTTAYTQAAGNIETIATLGTYSAEPTAGKCKFKEVDDTNHKGVYEFQFANARYAVTSAKSLLVTVSGASNLAECELLVELVPFVSVDANGRQDVGKVGGTTQTPADLGANSAAIKAVTDDQGTPSNTMVVLTATGGSATTFVSDTLPGSLSLVTNQWAGTSPRRILFDIDTTTAGLRGSEVTIASHTSGTTPTFTFSTLLASQTVASGDTGTLI